MERLQPTCSLERILCVLVPLSLSIVLFGIYFFTVVSDPDPNDMMTRLLRTAVKGNERYVIDHEIDRRKMPKVAISQQAWDVLFGYVSELPFASVAITTTGDHMDLVSSEIQITCPTAIIRCKSENGQVVAPRYFYVYDCTVLAENDND